jgi:hypothetical protein
MNPALPPELRAKSLSISLSPDEERIISELGDGSRTAGVKVMLELLRTAGILPKPEETTS